MKNKVLCVSDSLGLPRPSVEFEDTWFSVLQNEIKTHVFISHFRRNATTESLSEGDYGDALQYYKPEQIILQLGICDCSPRYIRSRSLLFKVVIRLPDVLSRPFWFMYKKFFKRTVKKAEVLPDKFEQNIRAYLTKCMDNGVLRVVIIQIATPAPVMTVRNPTVTEAVKLYNKLLEKMSFEFDNVLVVNPLCVPDDSLYTDGYHPNKYGNKLIADALKIIFKIE